MVQKILVTDSYIARIKVDRDMGEFFEWVLSLRPNIRGREILAAARFGFGVQKMNSELLLNRVSNQIASLPSLDLEPNAKSIGDESQTEDAGAASINTEQRMKELGYDLDFFTPPPATPH